MTASLPRCCPDVDLDKLGNFCLVPPMAKIRFGSIVSNVRGSIAGTVFSRNRGGAYIRNRTTPVDPSTVLQNASRGVFRDAVSAYVDVLTPAQRSAWYNYAFSTPYTDVFGDVRQYTAQQRFIQAYCALIPLGVPLSSFADAPSTTELPAVPDYDDVNPGIDSYVPSEPLALGMYDDTPGSSPIAIPAPEGVTVGAILLWAVSVPATPSSNSTRVPYRNVGSIAATDAGGGAIVWAPANFVDPWGIARAVGDRLRYRFRVLTPDGRLSAWINGVAPLVDYDSE